MTHSQTLRLCPQRHSLGNHRCLRLTACLGQTGNLSNRFDGKFIAMRLNAAFRVAFRLNVIFTLRHTCNLILILLRCEGGGSLRHRPDSQVNKLVNL